MSYDFYIAIDTGGTEEHYIEPFFSDEHPALSSDGIAGVAVVVTERGYSRCGNYTSNVSGMWMKCLTAAAQNATWMSWAGDDYRRWKKERPDVYADREVDTEHLCLRDLAGKQADQLVPLLRAAVEWGIEHLDELREDNPENGWGNAEGAVTYLWDIQRMCEQHPKGKLRISS